MYLRPYGNLNWKPMSPRTRKKVKYTRTVQLLLRICQLLGALGLLFCVICIKGTKGSTGWIIRVPVRCFQGAICLKRKPDYRSGRCRYIAYHLRHIPPFAIRKRSYTGIFSKLYGLRGRSRRWSDTISRIDCYHGSRSIPRT